MEAGLLAADDWTASLIVPDWDTDPRVDQPPFHLRRIFTIPDLPVRARLYITAHGVYEAELNGSPVGDQVLAPGWSSYPDRLRYQVYDVTSLLVRGDNCLGAIVADGWFRGHVGGRRNVYGERSGLIAQLELQLPSGATLTVVTDSAWRAAQGPTQQASLYHGETYDARLALGGWSYPSYHASAWLPVRAEPVNARLLVAPTGPPVRRQESLVPQIERRDDGRLILDFGQVIVGRLRIRPRGPSGTEITIRHAEVLEHGELCTRPLRLARATDRYVLAGAAEPEVWEPRFTLHGFRYAEIAGWPGEPTEGDIEAWVIHSDLERTGWFDCSDPDLTRLHENIVWSMRGNFVDVPTDCPQRDERLGWTGDLQVFAPTAAFLFDVSGLLVSWLRDLAADQRRYGTVPAYVPWVRDFMSEFPLAAWGDAAVVVPWVLYQRSGDSRVLEDQYESMFGWVRQVHQLVRDGLWADSGFQFGDWLDPAAPPDSPADARTDPSLIATAYHSYTARLLAQIARILHRDNDALSLDAIADQVRAGFRFEYLSRTGRVVGDTQTGYAVAIRFGLLEPGAERTRAAARLRNLLRNCGYRIGTGFVGTPLICDALTDVGAVDAAYHLLLQRKRPSWLYPVSMGATTIWERWDGLLPDGSVNPDEMTSFNHYALGAVGDWLHRVVAGLAPAEPGYRRVRIAPMPGGGLTRVRAAHETPYGRVEVRWSRAGETFQLEVSIPAGTTAQVCLPDRAATTHEIASGSHRFSCRFRAPEDDPPPERAPDIHDRYLPPCQESL